jgi:PAS domain S-box-containing protein
MDHALPKLIYDPESLRMLDVNHAAARMYGYTREEMLDLSVMDLRPPGLVEHVRGIVTSKGPPRRNFAIHRMRDGTELEVNVYSQLIDYGSGVARLATIMHAVAREMALQEDGLLLELVLRKLPAVVWTTDCTLRITRVEGGAVAAVGLTREELLDHPVTDVFDPAGDFVQCHQAALRGERCGCDVPFGEHVFSAALEPLRDETNKIVGVIGISFDVTERHEAEVRLRESEEQLWQSQKLESVGRLAGGVAHDFNNVLAAIAGHAELLAEMFTGEDPRLGSIDEIFRATQRARSLTRQLLAFSSRQVMHPQVIDLRKVVSEMERMLRRLIGRDVELHTSLGTAPVFVSADFTQLEQVLLNLVVNASDAMPGGGTLSITVDTVDATEPIRVVSRDIMPGRYVRLGVADTGSGIPPDVLPRIFEPFFTTKEQGRGTGLGLPTVFGIVDQSGGYISITSEVGAGTRFDILLPQVSG